MGHVPPGSLRVIGAGGHFQGRQHRGASGEGGVLSPDAGPDRRRSLGAAGEDRVAAWYESRGFEVLARNWRTRQGEIDLVARRAGLVVFCEVKTRTSSAFGEPFEAVTRTKQMRLRRLAAEWLRSVPHRSGYELRFDVASVRGPSIQVLEGAF
ncbi:MAG TPA: YraN family protein [Acidimicrobiales bacterium]|nr:YraN family protein [Acidimicrobiales bacterium]